MAQLDDRILEGATANDLASLQALAEGRILPTRRDIVPLHAKGWVDLYGDVAVITLTGRTLLDRQTPGFR